MEDLRQTSTQLNHAVQGLNELMEEALRIAGQATHNGSPEEIATIFNDATAHLRHSTVKPKQPRRRQQYHTDELQHVQEKSYKNGMPTEPPGALLPSPARRQAVRRNAKNLQDQQVEHHHLGLPPALSRAHLPNARPSQSMRRHARPRLDDPVELRYQRFPIRAQQYLRDERRPERVKTKDYNRPDKRLPVEPILQPVPPARMTPSPTSSSTSHGTSNATTIGPDDLDLKHPRKRHISIPAGHDISLGRHHHRQPIAREWPTYKKRTTALIACLNTVFIGLIVGIYVCLRATSQEQGDHADASRRAKCHGFSTRSRTRTIESSWAMFCKPQIREHFRYVDQI